jgi:hypothetical protein
MSDMAPRGRRHSGVGDSEPSRSSGRATFVTGCNLLAIYIRWQGGELTHPQFEKKNKSIYWWGIVHRYITIQLTRAQRGRCSNGTCPVGTEIMFQNPPDIRQPLHLTCSRLGRCGVYVSSLWNQVAICSKGMEGVSDWKEIATIQNPKSKSESNTHLTNMDKPGGLNCELFRQS